MEPIRVLHVVTYMGRGGLETMLMNYYRQIDKSRIQFDFLVHRDFEADYDKEIREMGGNIYCIPNLNPFSPAYYKALQQFFREHSYKIIHSHLDCMSAYPLREAKRAGVPVRIAHTHSKSQDKNLKYPIKLFSKTYIPRYATQMFACGEEAGKWTFCGKPFQIIRNAIFAKDYTFSEKTRMQMRKELKFGDELVIGHIGRFNPPKNHPFLIDIFKAVLKKVPNSKLVLVGDGDGRSAIEEKVKKLGIEKNVIFTGIRKDIPDLLQTFDLFLFPSLYEGLPVTMIEAQASGLPCVISDMVPKECIMTDLVESISLRDSAGVWADKIIQCSKKERENTYEQIVDQGYDIVKNAKELQEFYLKENRKYE